MNLSKNLSLKEAIRSQTATRKGIDNTPGAGHLEALQAIAENVFQPARDFFGVPIRVSSGYRSPALNKAIGGSKTSQHSKGEALDLILEGRNLSLFMFILNNLDFDQLIWEFGSDVEPDWVHVSYKTSGNRGEVLVADRYKGRVRYSHYEPKG